MSSFVSAQVCLLVPAKYLSYILSLKPATGDRSYPKLSGTMKLAPG